MKIFFALLFAPVVAIAQYTGPVVSTDLFYEGGLPETTAEVIMPRTLADNMNNVAIANAYIETGISPITNSSFSGAPQSFTLSTNSRGQITAWNLEYGLFTYTPGFNLSYTIVQEAFSSNSVSGDSFQGQSYSCDGVTHCGPDSGDYNLTGTAGTWFESVRDAFIPISAPSSGGGFTAPEIDPASAVSSLTLLLGGLAVLSSRRHRRV
jgi:hypothetical protein